MSRELFILDMPGGPIRQKVLRLVQEAPDKTRVEMKDAKRSDEQNARMWAMLGDISKQVEWFGCQWTKEDWKELFVRELQRETRFMPGMDGAPFPLGHRSSDLSVGEMSGVIEIMFKFGAEQGVEWSEPVRQFAGPESAPDRADEADARPANDSPEPDGPVDYRDAMERGRTAQSIDLIEAITRRIQKHGFSQPVSDDGKEALRMALSKRRNELREREQDAA
ncbi:recombination protein NinB [Euryhalocaulis caribicus]|uniref:recombination protein NinB n=1 Tax=Euryhalocaulis caribicus TaxID=1161401 RepID=UPI0003AAB0D4|nr:recombination protein NinB [Euryhalocaulis caribicus]